MCYWRIAAGSAPARSQCLLLDGGGCARQTAQRFAHAKDLLLPDGYSEIVFNLASTGFERWQLDDPARTANTCAAAMSSAAARTRWARTRLEPLRSRGREAGSAIPARDHRRTDLHEFRDARLSLRDLGIRGLARARGTLAANSCARGHRRAARRVFAEALRARGADLRRDALLHRIHRDRGSTPIMRWARDARIDARSLERAFCAATGMTPKQYARVIRFKRAYRSPRSRRNAAPLPRALDGFYDQSHFNREFRFFTGVAPGERLAGSMFQATNVTDHLLQAEPGADAH